ncbi:MAG: DUF4105 domain-containing protein [Oligoflexales bacterium]
MQFKKLVVLYLKHLTIFIFSFSSSAHTAKSIEIKFGESASSLHLDNEAQTKVIAFLDDVREILPYKMKTAIDNPIFVSFENIPKAKICSHVNAKILVNGSHQITIDQQFLNIITKDDQKLTSYHGNHKNALQLVKSMLIHEIAHIYYYKISKGPLKQFKNLFEFRKKGLIKKSRKAINKKIGRSPDAYEYKNEKEAFAVNMEYFLLDPNYSCRRPARNQFLVDHFEEQPFPSNSCNPANMLRMTGEGVLPDGQTGLYRHLDFSKVYGIHYLFAKKNKRIMGRWGHAMYRIIVCSPKRKLVSEECLQDIDHHLVLSFEGQIDDTDIDYIKGLKGEYPIHANVQTFEFARNKYRYYEDRGLLSVPLNLKKVNAEIFLKKILEMQEEYESPYYFFSNNCATEALDFLKSASRDLKLHDFHTNTPISMLNGLIKRGILDGTVLEDHEYALRKGYLWESNSEFMQKSILGIRSIDPDFKIETYSNYINLPNLTRLKIIKETIKSKPDEAARLNLYFFELEASISKNLVFSKVYQLLSLYKRGEDEQKLDDLELELYEALKRINSDFSSLLDISDHQANSYGIPLKEEFDEYYSKLTEKINEIKSHNKGIQPINDIFNRFFHNANQQIEEARQNKIYLKQSFQTNLRQTKNL